MGGRAAEPDTDRVTARIRLARSQHRQQIAQYPVKRLKFLDELGLNIAMTRRHGRAVHGKWMHDAASETLDAMSAFSVRFRTTAWVLL